MCLYWQQQTLQTHPYLEKMNKKICFAFNIHFDVIQELIRSNQYLKGDIFL